MVLSSLCPLFLLWGIRGSSIVPDLYFIPSCATLAFLPSAILYWRMCIVRSQKDVKQFTVGEAEDHRTHVLVYLFATLLPFYRAETESYRDLMAMFVALAFIVFLFWRLNLQYMNLVFAVMRYQVFTVLPPVSDNPYDTKEKVVLITRRRSLNQGDQVRAYRLSDTVYWENMI